MNISLNYPVLLLVLMILFFRLSCVGYNFICGVVIICTIMNNSYSAMESIYFFEAKERIEITSTPDIFNLSERDKLNLEKKSKDGDSNASFRLYEYYAFTLNDNNRLMEYLRTAALQGSVIAQYNLGIILSDKDLEQAIYWMDMAAKNGNINARNKLQEFKKLNSYTE